jgi:dTDP-4-dehydrorhamnose reductase
MTALVLGSSGQIASHLREHLPDAVFWGRGELDLAANPAALAAAATALEPSLIVNAAAYTAVDRAESDRSVAWRLNAEAPAVAASAAAALDVPLLHFSTDYVFDGRKPGAYFVDDCVGPLNVYGATKLAGEIAVRTLCAKHWILRTSWVFSEHGANFVKTMLRLAGERDRLRVVDDQRGNPTSALDLADAVFALIDHGLAAGWPWAPGEVFHAAGSGETTWCGFAREIFAISQAAGGPSCAVEEITTAEYPTLAKRPANSRLDCSKLAATLGRPFPDWRGSLQQTVLRLLAER